MGVDVFKTLDNPNSYGAIIYTDGVRVYQNTDDDSLPEPNITGLNNIYQTRFLTKTGPAVLMDTVLAEDFFSFSGTEEVVGANNTISFDQNDAAVINSVASAEYGHRPLDIEIEWTTSTTGTGYVALVAQIEPYISGASIGSLEYGTTVKGVFLTPNTGVYQSNTFYMTPESMGGLTKNDLYSVKITRLNTAEDTFGSGTINVSSVKLIESSNVY